METFMNIYQIIIEFFKKSNKTPMNKQMKRYLGQGPEDSQGSVLVEGVPPSQHMGVFTNSEALQTL